MLFRYMVICLLFVNVFAQNLVDIYRTKGINSVKNALDKKLVSSEYWRDYLKSKDVSIGYYETKKYIILTQKEQGELVLYKNINNKMELVSRSGVIVGEIQGDKQKSGDKKTPIGAYDLLEKKANVDQFYGPFALVTSYPNIYDKVQEKTGYGIWIHGMPLNGDREQYTKGCIALDNKKLEELDKNLTVKDSILITSQNELKKVTKEQIATILTFIYKWKHAWKVSNFKKYLSFYSKDFKRYDGMDLEAFKRYKSSIFNRKERKTIKFSDINIAPYPNSLNKLMFKIDMKEFYKSPAVTFNGEKELYVELVDNKVKILVED